MVRSFRPSCTERACTERGTRGRGLTLRTLATAPPFEAAHPPLNPDHGIEVLIQPAANCSGLSPQCWALSAARSTAFPAFCTSLPAPLTVLQPAPATAIARTAKKEMSFVLPMAFPPF